MRFYSECILSKSGFGDGDMLSEFLIENGFDIDRDSSNALLVEIVKTKVLPVITQKIDVITSSSHNPIRAFSIDGIEVDLCTNPQPKLTPEYIDIDEQFIVDLATSKFKPTTEE